MRKTIAGAGAAMLFVLSSSIASGGPLEDAVNSKLPPVSPQQQRAVAIASAIDTLSAAPDVNLAARIRLKDAEKALAARPEIQKLGVEKLDLKGQEQMLDAVVTIDRPLDGSVIPSTQPQLKSLFDKLHPQVRGTISVGLAVTSSYVAADKDQTGGIVLQLMPIFRSIKVESVKVSTGPLGEALGLGQIDMSTAVAPLVGWINGYADQISGALTRLDIAKLTLPSSPFPAVDANRSIQIRQKDGSNVAIKLNGNPASPAIRIVAAASMIDDGKIVVLARLVPPDQSTQKVTPAAAPSSRDFGTLKRLVDERLGSSLDMTSRSEGSWAAISKSQVASTLNTAFLQAHLCMSASVDIPKEEFSKKINLPSEKQIDCTPTKKCDPSHDTRDCNRCLVSVFGHCKLRGNDPTCEAAKAGQNAIYDGKKLACEAEKTATKDACEAKKGVVSAIAHTGNFANISGSFGTGSASLIACFQSVLFSPSLDKVDVSLVVGGQGSADTSIKFTPLDIVGHMTCQAPWTESKRVSVNLANQTTGLSATVKREGSEAGALTYRLNLRSSELAATMKPSPRDLILKSYNMDVACAPVALLVNAVTFSAAPFIPELAGSIHLPGQELSMRYDLKPTQLNLGGTALTLDFSDNKAALVAHANMK